MPIDYLRMQARTTRMLRQNGALYNVTRKGSVTVIGGVEHKTDDVQFTAIGVKTEYVVDIDGTAHRVIKPNPAKPASLVLCYKAQLRA